jgi:hypothetical protein
MKARTNEAGRSSRADDDQDPRPVDLRRVAQALGSKPTKRRSATQQQFSHGERQLRGAHRSDEGSGGSGPSCLQLRAAVELPSKNSRLSPALGLSFATEPV